MAAGAVPTPSGRIETIMGNPPGRQAGPTQHLIPVGPPPTYSGVPIDQIPELLDPRTRRRMLAPRAPTPAAPVMTIAMPKLDSTFITQGASPNIPWAQLIVNLYRLAQPTGIVPGTFAGITFNAYGQAISASESGVTFDTIDVTAVTTETLTVTGSATAPTLPANDNSTNVATTAFVHSQGFITGVALSGDVTGGGASDVATTVVGLQHRPVSAAGPAAGQVLGWNGAIWGPTSVLQDAPADGNVYGRQNGTWVVVSPAGGT